MFLGLQVRMANIFLTGPLPIALTFEPSLLVELLQLLPAIAHCDLPAARRSAVRIVAQGLGLFAALRR